MGFLKRVSSVVAPGRLNALSIGDYERAFYAGDDLTVAALGGSVSPDVALTLSYVYCAVDTISADLGTSTCQMFEDLGKDGRRRVQYSDAGIGVLAQMLRWQPNEFQTAKAFWSTMAWQYLLRPAAYAEIIYRPTSQKDGIVDQLIPRHPDRVQEARLPSGRIQFELRELDGTKRTLTQDEMFVVRNTSDTGLNALSRLQYGSKAIASGLTLQHFTSEYFEKGASAALLATYKGDKEEEDEDALHKSLSRFVSGQKNAGGIMLVSEDIDVKSLGVDPEKAQLLGLKNLSGRDVARLFKMPPSWLGIEGAASYSSQVQDSQNYVNRCQMPMVVEFEQAIHRDLIVNTDRYFAKFNLDYLLRGNLLERMQAYEIGIRSRIIRPSEARVREDMSPDEDLDQLSEGDYRPGTKSNGSSEAQKRDNAEARQVGSGVSARAHLRATLAVHDNAVRCVRRERAAVEKLAKKHPSDVAAWQSGLKDFYADHAGFVAQTMRVSIDTARAYAAQHGQLIEDQGVGVLTDHFERAEAEELAALALSTHEGVAHV